MSSERDIFAVCDLEVDYAYHFMEYLSRKKNIPFEVRVFTSAHTFLEFAKGHPVELLLISEKAMCSEIQEQEVGQVMILSEGVIPDSKYQYPSIYKYQSSDKVIREALACYGEKCCDSGKLLQIQKNKAELIGIYSPVGRTMKTTFALALGQILAKNRAVLYLNMEEYSGFEYLLGHVYEQTMGDLLYYLRQESPNLMVRMSGMVQTMNNLDFIPPVLTPGDIQHTSLKEWLQLLQEIIDYSNYETVILDLGDGVEDLYRLLKQCSKVYMPIRTDTMSQAKISQFESSLMAGGYEFGKDKIKKIKLPYHRTIRNGAAYLDDLLWSELGDFVRELVRTESGERGEGGLDGE
jgi:cellulose biosynthesis protein BcsQ